MTKRHRALARDAIRRALKAQDALRKAMEAKKPPNTHG